MKTTSEKIVDSSKDLSRWDRADQYWKQHGFRSMFSGLRKGGKLPASMDLTDPVKISKRFNFSGIEFGNWLTEEDRFNYLAALSVSCYDLNKVLEFSLNLGLDKSIGIAFGARGSGRALAHFEPSTWMINLTRYTKDASDKSKPFDFISSGGIGSFAHEYGHALDYFFGTYIEPDKNSASLSGGDSTAMNPDPTKIPSHSPMRHVMWQILNKIMFKKNGDQPPFYKNLRETLGETNTYWIRRNEMFARAFEQWVHLKLADRGIHDSFLTKRKYEMGGAYMDQKLLNQVVPLISKLIGLMAAEARKR